jgi:archaellin
VQKTSIILVTAAALVAAVLAYVVLNTTGITNTSETARTKALQPNK